MQLEKGEHTKTHTTGGRSSLLAPSGAAHAFCLQARFLVVFFVATVCLAPSAPVLAQHPAQHGASAQGAAKTRAADDASIRPFRINVPEEALVDLRRRIAATKWPERETVSDATQGVQLATMREARALLGDRLRLAQGGGEAERPAAIRHRRSMGSTSTSSTFVRSIRMPCRSSSPTAGPARSSSS